MPRSRAVDVVDDRTDAASAASPSWRACPMQQLGGVVGRAQTRASSSATRRAGQHARLGAELLRQPQVAEDAVALGLRQAQQRAASRRRPRAILRRARRRAASPRARAARRDGPGRSPTTMRSPAAQTGAIAFSSRYSRICASTRSAVCRSAISRSAIRLPFWKKFVERALDLLRHVDLALAQTLEQLVGRQVDQLDFVGGLEDRIGQAFR